MQELLQHISIVSVTTCAFTPCKEWSPNHRSQAAANGTQCLTIAIDHASCLSQGGVADEYYHTCECHYPEWTLGHTMKLVFYSNVVLVN